MRQIQIISYGGPDRLQAVDVPQAAPGKRDVTIQVRYAGINFADIMCRIGLYPNAPKPPFAPGYEVAGIISEVGTEVDSSLVGKPVVSMTNFGGYATHVTVPHSRVIPLNDEDECRWAVAMPVNYLTAQIMLFRQAALRSGEWVLIFGIGGGVGVSALQLAQKAGANVIGTASEWKHDRLRDLGVKYLLDPQKEDVRKKISQWTNGKGVDVVLDPIGGKHLKLSYELLNPLGRLVAYGFSTAAQRRRHWLRALQEYRATPKFNPIQMMRSNKGVFGFHLGFLGDLEGEMGGMLTELIHEVREGRLKVIIDREFPLSLASEAHQYIHERKNFGKIILNCQESKEGAPK